MSPPATQRAIDRTLVLELLGAMLRIRRFEDRCAELYQQEKIRGFLHLYNGEEAVAVGVMRSLTPADSIVATYREHGHALARGVPMDAVMAELYGKRTGVSGGRGGSMHLFHKPTRFYGGNAIVGGGLPLAVGLALAERMQKRAGIAVCFFGEGAMAEGEFHESMNLAALWQLPVLLVCENNLYAMGTALKRSEAESDLVVKSLGYRVPAVSVDGMDTLACLDAAENAVTRIRAGEGPRLLEFRTYRFRAHSMYDAQLYRDREEVKAWEARGPLISFTNKFKAAGLMTEDDYQALVAQADREVEAAVAFAESSEWEPVESLRRHVYAEVADT
jgi:pyruvate dehydrogenase E1 component alpha subunit